MSKNNRLLSLDVFRGLTVAGMILVNTPGSWSYVFAPLGHASWNGLTPTDLVFPFFMFIMGMSMFISLRKEHFVASAELIKKIVIRSVLIFFIGLFISWLARGAYSYPQIAAQGGTTLQTLATAFGQFSHLRILGVLQRLAICYAVVSLLCLVIQHRYIPLLVATGLLVYWGILFAGHGFEQSENNIISIVDSAILGTSHMYKDGGIALDPEGLLSTFPSIFHTFIGFYCARLLFQQKDRLNSMLVLFVSGTSLLFIGYLISYGCPINKKIWSPSFVLVTSGIALLLLALLMWIIDFKQHSFANGFFAVFGVNPLFSYILSALITTIFFDTVYFGKSALSIHTLLYEHTLQPLLGNYFASLCYAITCVLVIWFICYPLYKKQIYIKL